MIKEAVQQILLALGEDPNREGLLRTPERVAKMFSDVLDGNHSRPPIPTTFEELDGVPDQVVTHNTPFYAYCEHHMAIFTGTVAIGYVPKDNRVIGLSKLVRIFRYYCKRPTIQERIGMLTIKAILAHTNGAICQITAEHTCMSLRGIKSAGARTTTLTFNGAYSSNADLIHDFKKSIKNG